MSSNDITVDIDGFQLAAKTWGDPSQPPILALHGWLDNAASFELLAPLLSGFYVIAVDLPGHGLSTHLNEQYSMDFYLDCMLKLIDTLGWQEYYLLGHSLGGAVSSMLASHDPERVIKTVFIDSMGPISAEVIEEAMGFVDDMKIGKPRKNIVKTYSSLERAIRTRTAAGDVTEKIAAILASRGVQQGEKGWYWGHDRALLQPSKRYLPEEEILELFSQITCPVLLIEASEGILEEHILVEQRMECIKHFTKVRLSGTHHLHMQTPEQVAKYVLNFFAPQQMNSCEQVKHSA